MDEQPKTKKCSICGEEKPLSKFYKNIKAKDGYQASCKKCAPRNVHKKDYIPKTKICSRCHVRKNKSEFSKNATRADGLQTYCKMCSDAYQEKKEADKIKKMMNGTNPKKPTITGSYIAAIEGSQEYSIPKTNQRDHRIVPPRKPKPDRTKIRERKKPRTTSLTKKEFYYKGWFLNIYNALGSLGVSDINIARLSGENPKTFKGRINGNMEADESYQEAMAELELRLSHLLLVKAKGYDFEEVKFRSMKSPKTGEWVEVEKTTTTKHHPGEIQALIFYLTNRFPDRWKVSRELITGKKQTYDDNPSKRNRKAIESIASNVLEQDTDKSEGERSVQNGVARVSGGSEQAGEK